MKRKEIICLVFLFGVLVAINFFLLINKKKLHGKRSILPKLESVKQSKKSLLKMPYQAKIKILKGKNIPPLKKEREKIFFSQLEKKEKSFSTPSFYKMFDEEIEMLIKNEERRMKDTQNQNIIPPSKILKKFKEKGVIIY